MSYESEVRRIQTLLEECSDDKPEDIASENEVDHVSQGSKENDTEQEQSNNEIENRNCTIEVDANQAQTSAEVRQSFYTSKYGTK